jgi:hypothetical protein
MNLGISFWPQGPTIAQQLKQQGFEFSRKDVNAFEKRKDVINDDLTSGKKTHAESFSVAKELGEEINRYVLTYVKPEPKPKKKAVKKGTKKAVKKAAKKK